MLAIAFIILVGSTLTIATGSAQQNPSQITSSGKLSVANKSVGANSDVRQRVVTVESNHRVNKTANPVDPYEVLRANAQPVLQFNRLVKSVIQVCRPTVVHIEARKSIKKSNGALTRIEEAGAGVIIQHRDRMFVVTNRHVIADAKLNAIRIQTHNGRFFGPTDLRVDRDTDIAVLYLSEKDLDASRWADSDAIELGDFVIAIGSPFGLNHSISKGIISGKGRRDLDLGANGVRLQDFLQTDAAINPGNSGVPLLNVHGEVIGINTAIASNSGHNEGIGFAIPSNMVKRVATDLIDYGKVRRGILGVSLDSKYTADKAKQIGLNTIYGARVTAITPGSPADGVDIRIGDVILQYDGKSIENDSHLVNEVNMTTIGKQVAVVLFRRGERKTVQVKIRQRSK